MDRKSYNNRSPDKKPTKNRNDKTPSPLYANVAGAGYVEKDLTRKDEPTYCNTMTTKRRARPKTIYCNENYQDLFDNIYSDINETESRRNTQDPDPLYDILLPLARDNMDCPPSPVSSSYSELQKADSYEYATNDCSSQTSKWYESIYEPINPPSALSSTFAVSSISESISTREHDTGAKSLASVFTNSLSITEKKTKPKTKKKLNRCLLSRNCIKCNTEETKESPGNNLVDNFNSKYFTCNNCGNLLNGLSFYQIDKKLYCKDDYLNKLEKCGICHKPIMDRILRATGHPFHPDCFRCIVCSMSLDNIQFTVDTNNQVYCIEDFQRMYAPKCSACKLPISPNEGEHETLRYVSLDRSFHVHCYKCEDCGMLLRTEAEGRGCYPLDDHLLCKSCNAIRIQDLTLALT